MFIVNTQKIQSLSEQKHLFDLLIDMYIHPRVAETLYNPFGEDDDDFELNELLNRHFKGELAHLQGHHKYSNSNG